MTKDEFLKTKEAKNFGMVVATMTIPRGFRECLSMAVSDIKKIGVTWEMFSEWFPMSENGPQIEKNLYEAIKEEFVREVE